MPLNNLQFMPTLPIPLPEQLVLMRLGYVAGQTALTGEQRDALRRRMEQAFRFCNPAGTWGTLEITDIRDNAIYFQDGTAVVNDILSRKLSGCSAVWLGTVTIGPALGEYCARCFAEHRGSDAAVADAVGSETAEKAIGFLQHYASSQLLRRGITMTSWRFSPGYSNWTLEDQTKFYEWLQMDRLGIRLSETFIMHPEKSVTALAGLKYAAGRQL